MRILLSFLVLLATAAVDAANTEAGRPVYAVREYPEVTITGINSNTKRISVKLPRRGGSHSLQVGPKTWIIKDGDEASFADLRVGQRLRVRYIPRGGQAVTLEVLPPTGEK
jgi:hypothetical protein